MIEKSATRGPNKGRVVAVPQREPVRDRKGNVVYVEARTYTIDYIDAGGRRRTTAGYTDKTATEQKAADIARSVARQRAGIIDVAYEHTDKAIDTHIKDWLADLKRSGRVRSYTRNVESRIKKLAGALGWQKLTSIRMDTLTGWLTGQQRAGLSQRTVNHYVEAATAFCTWCLRQRRLENNPLVGIAKAEVVEPTCQRRAATLDELRRLIAVNDRRGLVYLTVVLTGLRRNELRQLQWGDVRLDDPSPYLALRAATTKAKRADTIPIPPQLADALRKHRPKKWEPIGSVFDRIPRSERFQSDLVKAEVKALQDGRKLDLHALRTTYGTMLAASGVNIRTAMELMRHTDIRLTTKTYTDVRLLDTAGAANRLPHIDMTPGAERMKATGTHGKDAEKTYAQTYAESRPKRGKTVRMDGDDVSDSGTTKSRKNRSKQAFGSVSESDTVVSQKWARRESNPHPLARRGF